MNDIENDQSKEKEFQYKNINKNDYNCEDSSKKETLITSNNKEIPKYEKFREGAIKTPFSLLDNDSEQQQHSNKITNTVEKNKIVDSKSEVSNNSSKSYQILFKIILIGDSGIGKTSLINRYVKNEFSEKHLCTIGVDFMMKTLEVNDVNIKLQVWDTAGMERYRQITTSYYKGANAAIIAFDLTNRKSFESLKYWITLYYDYCNQLISKCIAIVGNKLDAEHKREVTKEDIEDFLKINPHLMYYEVSAKSGEGVENLFTNLAERLYNEVINNGFSDFKDRRNTGSYKSINTGDFENLLKKNKKCKC